MPVTHCMVLQYWSFAYRIDGDACTGDIVGGQFIDRPMYTSVNLPSTAE